MEGGENDWQLKLSRRVFFQKISSSDIFQIEANIKNPFRKDIEKNIPKTLPNPMVDGRDMAAKFSTINVFSL